MQCPHCGMEIERPLLTNRELEIVEIIATNDLKFNDLLPKLGFKSVQTARNAAHGIYRKLGIKSRLELINMWANDLFKVGAGQPVVRQEQEQEKEVKQDG